MNIRESDWKKFKPLRDKALARFCDRVLSDIASTSVEETLSSHEKYLKIYEQIRDYDKEIGHILNGYSRSRALLQLAMIQSKQLLSPEELECFGESTQEYLAHFKQ